MVTKTITRLFASLIVAVGAQHALAEDIDIYSQNTTVTANSPNVLIYVDNTANWSQSFGGSTKFAAEKTALAIIVNALKSQFRLGIMLSSETGGGNSTLDGGYVRLAIQEMTDTSATPPTATAARNCLLKMVGNGNTCTLANSTYYTNLDINNDKSNGGKAGKTMAEMYEYFAGINSLGGGTNKVKADYTRVFTSAAIAGPTYIPPDTQACQKNFIIIISNGPFQDNSSDTATAMANLASVGGDTTIINPPDTSSNNNAADEWARFLNKSSVQARIYTLEVGPSTTGQGPYNTALLQSIGRQGQGGYYSAVDSTTLLAALQRIFNDIQAVNSVFASASLPLSADNSGAYADQVYVGVFRPDGGGNPRWVGNLKQYKFALDNNRNLFLADALGAAAGGATGFAQPDAVSFWTSKDTSKAPDAPTATATDATTGSTNGFWYYDSKGTGGNYDDPDGEWVEKGGAAQQLRLAYLGYGGRGGIGSTNTSTLNSKAARQVYTCIGSCLTTGTALSATPFDTSNSAITSIPGAFGISSSATVSGITSTQSVTTLQAGTLNGNGTPDPKTIAASGLAVVSNVVTITTSGNHGYSTGNYVTISGSGITGTNGTFLITVPSGSFGNRNFTYTVSGVSDSTSCASGCTATKANTTAYVTTSAAHNLSSGATIYISGAVCPSTGSCPFNGTFTVASVPSTTTLTYTLSSGGVGATATGTVTVAAALARATTSTAHGYSNGDSVTVAGASCSPSCAAYNGTFTISNVTSTTFDYAYSGSSPFLGDATNSGMTATDNTATNTQLLTLIKWIRGLDTQNENGFQVAGANTDVRASIHGDVLHSRPVVLNYGTGGTNNVYVFYGGNDGIFRAIKGGQSTTPPSEPTTEGIEQWAFVPSEFFGRFKRLYDNSPPILYPSTSSTLIPTPTGTCNPSTTACATRREYFWDGPVASFIERNSSGTVTRAYLYISVRRGGRFIYALDVTTPTNPKFLWKKGCPNLTNDTGCDSGFSEMGETWSVPIVARVRANTNPVLIFGGGLDQAAEDVEPPSATDSKGRAIYMLDAFTGSPIWTAVKSGATGAGTTLQMTGMDFSVAADVLAVDRTLDGLADRLYSVDAGGNVWRFDIDDASPSNWAGWLLATLADRSVAAARRKFIFGPDVVLGANNGAFDAVVLGSGDREHPLSTNVANGVINRAYMIIDTHTGTTGAALGVTDTCGATIGACTNLFDATNSSSVPLTGHGWFVTMSSGEQVVNGPIVFAGQMIFGTNQPDPTNLSCNGNLGIAKRYALNFLTGAGGVYTDAAGNLVRSQTSPGGGFLPSPVAGIVEINGSNYNFVVDNPFTMGPTPPITVNSRRYRTYWRETLE